MANISMYLCYLRNYSQVNLKTAFVKHFSITCSNNHKYSYRTPEDAMKIPEVQFPTASPSDRRVYVWGLAEHGALGNQRQKKNKKTPQQYKHRPIRLHFAEHQKIIDIACGYGFTAFAVNSKDKFKVFGCGINTDSQIGYHSPRRDNPLEIILSPAPIELPFANVSTTKVTSLAAGRAHLCVLTNDEGAFLLGNNAYGQCARRVIEDENYHGSVTVNNIADLNGIKIKHVECGQDHTMFINETGQVFSCGWGADGQTGLGHYRSTYIPSLVVGDVAGENIVKLSCSADCVLALNDKGQVFGWGNSEYSQLPTAGDNQQINASIHLGECDRLGKIVDIAAGGSFCAVVNEDGNVFVWGYGILGFGPRVDRCKTPSQIPPALFGRNEFAPDTRVVGLAAGLGHLGAVTNSGDLFLWGRNRGGCLGLGHVKDQYFPLRVAVGATVQKVRLGVDHSVALCKPFA